MAENWNRRFDDTIEVPDGPKIRKLDDARAYLITFAVPKQPHKRDMLAVALRCVLGAANGTDVMMHARIAVGRCSASRRPAERNHPDAQARQGLQDFAMTTAATPEGMTIRTAPSPRKTRSRR